MGKASKFFRSLLGFKTTEATAPPPSRSDPNKQPKRRWSFVKSDRDKQQNLRRSSKSFNTTSLHHRHHSSDRIGGIDINEDPNKHAIALATATAAVVDAAVAAARVAAEVVRMTGRTTGYGVRNELAAVKIQSYFRGYLARRALRALKALVKLQAVVRGHILRKQTADMMRRLQVLMRAQARARTSRSQISDSPHSNTKASSHFHLHAPPTPDKNEQFARAKGIKHDHPSVPKRNDSKSYVRGTSGKERKFLDGLTDDENDKIVEVDTAKPYVSARRKNLFHPEQISFSYSQSLTTSKGSTIQPTSSSPCASCKVNYIDVSMRGGPSTPIKSDGSRSCISGYSDHPNYMAYTESSRAKVRSLSAPRLRPRYEISNTTKRDSGSRYVSGMQRVPTMRDRFPSRAYAGSGRLDRLVMSVPVVDEFCGGYWN